MCTTFLRLNSIVICVYLSGFCCSAQIPSDDGPCLTDPFFLRLAFLHTVYLGIIPGLYSGVDVDRVSTS